MWAMIEKLRMWAWSAMRGRLEAAAARAAQRRATRRSSLRSYMRRSASSTAVATALYGWLVLLMRIPEARQIQSLVRDRMLGRLISR